MLLLDHCRMNSMNPYMCAFMRVLIVCEINGITCFAKYVIAVLFRYMCSPITARVAYFHFRHVVKCTYALHNLILQIYVLFHLKYVIFHTV